MSNPSENSTEELLKQLLASTEELLKQLLATVSTLQNNVNELKERTS